MSHQRTGSPVGSWSCILKVVGLSLTLQTVCWGQAIDYFNTPLLRFGNFFYVSLPNRTLDLLYECLCDVHITQCKLMYGLYEGIKTEFDFPYYYSVSDIRFSWFKGSHSARDIYSSSVQCDALTHSPKGEITCNRLPLSDDTCLKSSDNCKVYSVPQNSSICSFDCTRMVFIADFTLDIQYMNFGGVELPVKGDVCSTDGVNGQIENVQTNQTQALNSKSSSSSIPISKHPGFVWAGVVAVGAILAISVLVFAGIAIKRRNSALKNGASGAGISDLSSATGSCNTRDHKPLDVGGSGLEIVTFPNVEDQMTLFNECDEDGYVILPEGNTECSVVQDAACVPARKWGPLPPCPDSTDDVPHTKSIDDVPHTESTDDVPHIESTDDVSHTKLTDDAPHSEFTDDVPYSTESIDEIHHKSYAPSTAARSDVTISPGMTSPPNPDVSVSISSSLETRPDILDDPHPSPPPIRRELSQELTTDSVLSNVHHNPPRAHRRLVDLDDHEYLGLVNLRPDQAVLGQVSEVKLVRSKLGQLELVSADNDQCPVYSDYYTRILLVHHGDNALGVVGVLEGTLTPTGGGDAMLKSGPIDWQCEKHTCGRQRFESCGTQQPVSCGTQEDLASIGSTGGAVVGYPGGGDDMFLEVIYIGSIQCDDDTNFNPCEYLNVLESEANCEVCGWGGYLTAQDVENVKTS